jgi:hypothetical protein
MRLALLLLAWSAGCLAQVPKVLVTEIQPGFKPAHSIQVDGDTLVYTTRFGAEIQTRRITPPPERWTAFRRTLDRQNVWRWKGNYERKAPDSTRWLVKIEYDDRSLAAAGLGAFPSRGTDRALPKYAFTRYRYALQELLGEPFERRIKSIELYDVKELRLVGTNTTEQWASFRDPRGTVHQVAVDEPAGGNATLQKIDRSSVEVSVLGSDKPHTIKVVAK